MSAMKAGRSKMLKLARVPVDIGGQFIFRSFGQFLSAPIIDQVFAP